MDPRALIETYVDDVARRLPGRLRTDVGAELRALLDEELAGQAADAGRPADEAMALSLLRAFGAPADVADRYRPAGFTIVKPTDAPGFAIAALGGVALQWAITLPAHFARSASADAALGALGGWWLSFGIGAFWWPGFMVSMAIIAAWVGQHRAAAGEWTPPDRVIDRDRVNRGWLGLGLAFWAAGAAFWIAEPWLMGRAPPAIAAALQLDPTFLAQRAIWLLPLWAAQFAVYVWAFWQGRWSPRLRALGGWVSLAISALIAWYIVAGPVFAGEPADKTAKFITALIVIGSLAVEGWRFFHRPGRLARPPTDIAMKGA